MIIRDIHPSKPIIDLDTRVKGYRVSQNISVTWSWYDENQGIVEWTFHNLGRQTESVILLRNGYYFGGAFGLSILLTVHLSVQPVLVRMGLGHTS